jgi:NAD-dependent SIR2 family protein deacetylase
VSTERAEGAAEELAAGRPSCPVTDDIGALQPLLQGRRMVVLTGAGCSTESGIPDYRGPGRTGPPRQPILHDAFMRRPEVRQRYWARATLGWRSMGRALPNRAHHALAALEAAGRCLGVITQNVDRLHQAAGSQRVVELHGALADVRCLACADSEPREQVHRRLLAANPGWVDRAAPVAPDGDALLDGEVVGAFRVVACLACGGVLKPDVVFFGGNVAPAVRDSAFDMLEAAEALLVVGSSLQVFSGYRFVRRAAERCLPVAILNIGATRGDPLADLRVEAPAGLALTALAAALG